ncbi:MAG: four helix bundle protein [Pirellulales bacterium]|nr:four helix bundle protein [Pirellulales bacterium]
MRRLAISVPSNIAEGQGRRSRGEFRRFLLMAHGSLRELETQTIMAQRLKYLSSNEASRLHAMTAEIGRLLNGLIRSQKPVP